MPGGSPQILGTRSESCCEHPRHDSGGVGRPDARLHPGKHRLPCPGCPRRGNRESEACVSCFSAAERRRAGVGSSGPRAQRLPLPQAAPRHCPAHPGQSELCPRLGPGSRPPTFQQGPREAGTDRAFRMHACRGTNYYRELSAMSTGWHFTCQRLSGPALALAAWLQGPHSNCARTETLFSPAARGLRPSPSVQHPSAGPRPSPTQGPGPPFSTAQHGAD